MKNRKHIAAVLSVAALAVPAGVAAKGPSGDHGKSGQQHGTPQNNKPHHVNNRCKHQPNVGFSLGGTLDPSSTASAIVVDVTHANKHSKPWVQSGKYSVPSGSNVRFVGANPFTTQPTPDFTKYKVHVNGKVVKLKKGCTAANSPSPTIKKVTVIAPESSQSGSNLESGSNMESGSNLQS
jgi:hypothetical protein